MLNAGDFIYVIEFKLNKTAGEAMKQIENREYALKYRKEGKHIMLLGVNFDFERLNGVKGLRIPLYCPEEGAFIAWKKCREGKILFGEPRR